MKFIWLLLLLIFIFSQIAKAGRTGRQQLPRPGNPLPRPRSGDENDDRSVPGPWSQRGERVPEMDRPASGRRSGVDDGYAADGRPVAGPWSTSGPASERTSRPGGATARRGEKPAATTQPRRYRKDEPATDGMPQNVRDGRRGGEVTADPLRSDYIPERQADGMFAATTAPPDRETCPEVSPGACGDVRRLLSPGNLAAAVVLSEMLGPRGGRRAGRR
ncbi:hypothetical protein [Desulfotomaculum copahuensis]|uniref:Uncharacterized protein n=1 Tax=Desulfotomaculum copahuensis TaxID=1838280 RepID=A0A1B7LF68_9FIRM|nr:hypothetical protein [Desulfotomaculum copahuensis]OAT82295.1 hypothetical protein A6M21_09060 [Desulfotomaculum copahuensis]